MSFEVNTGLFDLELVEATFAPLYASLYQFYATDAEFERRPVGSPGGFAASTTARSG